MSAATGDRGSGDGQSGVVIRIATAEDLDTLVALGRRFYAADRHHFVEARVRTALAGLLAQPHYGTILVVEQGPIPVGYAVVTRGYSIESGGVDALLDEIYLDIRGQGLGSDLLDHVLDEAHRWGASRLFLETEAHNDGARSFYRRHHFIQDDSIWLSIDL